MAAAIQAKKQFIRCNHRYAHRFPQTEKLENGVVVRGKDGRPVLLPEVFLPEGEKNTVMLVSPEQIENLKQSIVFMSLYDKGDYQFSDKMPEEAKTDTIRLAERDEELRLARIEIERLTSIVEGQKKAGGKKGDKDKGGDPGADPGADAGSGDPDKE